MTSEIFDISHRLQRLVRARQLSAEGSIVVAIPAAAFDRIKQEVLCEIERNSVSMANGSKLVFSGEFKINDVIFRREESPIRSLTDHAFDK